MGTIITKSDKEVLHFFVRFVLTAVALADAVFLVVLAMEVELQVVDNLTSLFL